jgi:hypothetical protein
MAIKAERPVHLLLCGPPSSGKSLFMSSLTRLERSHYAVRSSSTKSGIFDYLFEYRPSWNGTGKLLPPLLARFRDIHFKPYTEEEFVEIVVNVLDREEGVDRDIAL